MKKLRYKEIGDYYVCNVSMLSTMVLFNDSELSPNDVRKEVENIFYMGHNPRLNYIRQEEIAFLKDSIIGNYIEKHPEQYINENLEITYEKIVGAYNMAVITDDEKMANKIYPFFMDYLGESRADLLKNSCSNVVVDYILNNSDFFGYIDRLNGAPEKKEYLVYENGDFQTKCLQKGVQKVKK